jgi:glutamate---cysteine ligase / carboxylate-amine ligase
LSNRILPAPVQAARLLDHVRPALENYGDVELVADFFQRLQARGTGAERQRASAARHGVLTAVVDDLISETART